MRPRGLREQCEKGLVHRYGTAVTPEIRERFPESELAVVEKMGFPPTSSSCGILSAMPSGPISSSWPRIGCRLAMSYLLGITDLDPIAHDLPFERFLNPDCISMPDIDIDFSVNGREKDRVRGQ